MLDASTFFPLCMMPAPALCETQTAPPSNTHTEVCCSRRTLGLFGAVCVPYSKKDEAKDAWCLPFVFPFNILSNKDSY